MFYPPSRSSFSNQSIVHQAGQERPPERELGRQCLMSLGDLTKQTEGISFEKN